MIELEEKSYLFLLIIIPVLIGFFIYVLSWKKKKQAEFGDVALLEKLTPDLSKVNPIIKIVLVLFSFFFLIIALVNPKFGTTKTKVTQEGIDVVFAIDVSKSMLAEDVAPNRLEKSKQLVTQIINKLGTDRIGIIAYSGSAFPVLPMTSDYSVAKMFLQGINTSIISSQGTSIDEAINLSTQYFNKKEKTRKLLVIISDGEDHSNNAVDAAEDAKEAGIKIITIGVGSEKGAKIPVKENGLFSGYQQDKQGDIVVTKRDATILNEIAKSTNGSYIDGNNTKNVVDFIIQKISKIEKTEFKNMQMANFKSQFQWFLAIAFFLLLLDTFITERKLEWFKKLNLFQKKETL